MKINIKKQDIDGNETLQKLPTFDFKIDSSPSIPTIV